MINLCTVSHLGSDGKGQRNLSLVGSNVELLLFLFILKFPHISRKYNTTKPTDHALENPDPQKIKRMKINDLGTKKK